MHVLSLSLCSARCCLLDICPSHIHIQGNYYCLGICVSACSGYLPSLNVLPASKVTGWYLLPVLVAYGTYYLPLVAPLPAMQPALAPQQPRMAMLPAPVVPRSRAVLAAPVPAPVLQATTALPHMTPSHARVPAHTRALRLAAPLTLVSGGHSRAHLVRNTCPCLVAGPLFGLSGLLFYCRHFFSLLFLFFIMSTVRCVLCRAMKSMSVGKPVGGQGQVCRYMGRRVRHDHTAASL